jgi:hypothetical protein
MDRGCRLEDRDQRMGETRRGDVPAEILDRGSDGTRHDGLALRASPESACRLDPDTDVGIAQGRLETPGVSSLLSPGPDGERADFRIRISEDGGERLRS